MRVSENGMKRTNLLIGISIPLCVTGSRERWARRRSKFKCLPMEWMWMMPTMTTVTMTTVDDHGAAADVDDGAQLGFFLFSENVCDVHFDIDKNECSLFVSCILLLIFYALINCLSAELCNSQYQHLRHACLIIVQTITLIEFKYIFFEFADNLMKHKGNHVHLSEYSTHFSLIKNMLIKW